MYEWGFLGGWVRRFADSTLPAHIPDGTSVVVRMSEESRRVMVCG